jgi:hypothetical protein
VLQTLPSNRAEEPLGVGVLSGALQDCENLLDAQRLDSQPSFNTVTAVAIADEIRGSLAVCECLYDLLYRPTPCDNRTLEVIVGRVKKSIETICPTWLCRNVLHVWFGGRRRLRRMRDTVRSERVTPSIFSSPWILGGRHNGLAAAMLGDLDAAAAAWTTWPRICGTVPAVNRQACLPGRR